MPTPLWRSTAGNLARHRLVLSPGRARRAWLLGGGLVIIALAIGATGSHLYWRDRLVAAVAPAAPPAELQPLRQALEQARMQLRVTEARSQELERQIDALNQRLRECQDELAFFRKTRDGKPRETH